MVVDLSVLRELGHQVQRENVFEVEILGGDLHRGLFSNQARYLRPLGRVNVGQGGVRQCIGTD